MTVSHPYAFPLGAFFGFCTEKTPGPLSLFRSFCGEADVKLIVRDKETYAAMAYASNPSSMALPAASVARLDTALVDIM